MLKKYKSFVDIILSYGPWIRALPFNPARHTGGKKRRGAKLTRTPFGAEQTVIGE